MVPSRFFWVPAAALPFSAAIACGLSTGGLTPGATGTGGETTASSGTSTTTSTVATGSTTATTSGPGGGVGGETAASTTTTTTSGGGFGGGTGGFGGGTGGGGGPPVEDCLDGEDDDGDGLADCQDPDCTVLGFACVKQDPEALAYAIENDGVNACPPRYEQRAYYDCGGCTCSPGTTGTCQAQVALFVNAAACAATPIQSFGFPMDAGDACFDSEPDVVKEGTGSDKVHFIASATHAGDGECQPDPLDPLFYLCVPVTLGAGSCEKLDEACVQSSNTDCVLKSPMTQCTTDYDALGIAGVDLQPESGLDTCQCGCDKLEGCGTSFKFSDDGNDNCAGAATVASSGMCQSTSKNSVQSMKGPLPTLTCTPTSQPVGGGPVKICCK